MTIALSMLQNELNKLDRRLAQYKSEESVYQHRFGSNKKQTPTAGRKGTVAKVRKFQITTPRGSYVVQCSDRTAKSIAKEQLVKPYALKEGVHHNLVMDGTVAGLATF
jgi:hypothetical protein